MAKKQKKAPPPKGLAPATWALVGTAGVTCLLIYAGVSSGNWRGVLVTQIQVIVVGAAAWYGLRSEGAS